jgi:hypothetical protein
MDEGRVRTRVGVEGNELTRRRCSSRMSDIVPYLSRGLVDDDVARCSGERGSR